MHRPPDPQTRNPAAANGRVYRSISKAWLGSVERYYTIASIKATNAVANGGTSLRSGPPKPANVPDGTRRRPPK